MCRSLRDVIIAAANGFHLVALGFPPEVLSNSGIQRDGTWNVPTTF